MYDLRRTVTMKVIRRRINTYDNRNIRMCLKPQIHRMSAGIPPDRGLNPRDEGPRSNIDLNISATGVPAISVVVNHVCFFNKASECYFRLFRYIDRTVNN